MSHGIRTPLGAGIACLGLLLSLATTAAAVDDELIIGLNSPETCLPETSVRFTAGDLEGYWTGVVFGDRTVENQPRIVEVLFDIDAAGDLSGILTEFDDDSDEIIYHDIASGSLQITSLGNVSGDFVLLDTVGNDSEPSSHSFSHFQMNDGRDLIGGVDRDPEGPGIAGLAKIGSDYTLSDLAGTWALFGYSESTGDNAPNAFSGMLEIDASGNLVSGSTQSTAGGSEPEILPSGSIQFAIDEFGRVFQTAGQLGGEPVFQLAAGKELAVGAAIGFLPGGNEEHIILFLVKESLDVTVCDLNEDWVVFSFSDEEGDTSTPESSEGSLYIDATQSLLVGGYTVSSSGVTDPIEPHLLDVQADGEVILLPGWTRRVRVSSNISATGTEFGSAVATDGDVLVVGDPSDEENGSNSGAAHVFRRNESGQWVPQAKLLAQGGTDGDALGRSVAVEGDLIVLGAAGRDDNGSESGGLYVFRYTDETWLQEALLVAGDGTSGDALGHSVALSDGVVLAGAARPGDYLCDPGCDGAAYVFSTDGEGGWSQSAKLVANDGTYADHFGISVALSGSTAIVGGYGHPVNGTPAGASYVFTESAGIWTQQAKLVASDAGDYQEFGSAVAILGDTALVGAPRANADEAYAGAAYVFTRSGSAWAQQAKLTKAGGTYDDNFGSTVALSDDFAIVGTQTYYDAGSVSIYRRNQAGWPLEAFLTVPDTEADAASFGEAVSIIADGHVLAVGATGDEFNTGEGSETGYAYVYDFSSGGSLQFSPAGGVMIGTDVGARDGGQIVLAFAPEPGAGLLGLSALAALAALRRRA